MPDIVRESARAALFLGADQPLEIRSLPLRRPDAKEVLVEVTLCTLCGSDVHSFEGRRAVATPTILGHEILGRIVE
ncbi:MAG TPA: alcohol dehydrogenase catalytic domain-containing protein, partial [Pirellulaceae bacterium]|nr:alcohol dehydrogenase catalytic domain-containing protein [Pirellulaceae bacterium]